MTHDDNPQQPPASVSNLRVIALVFLVVLVADQVTKQIMLGWIFFPPMRVAVLPLLNFSPVWNPGMSFGLLADGGMIVRVGLLLLAVAVALWLFYQHRQLTRRQAIAAGLIAGGAIGNAIDRLRFGKVVDFIDVYVQEWHWPVFNVADAAISVGALFWAYTLFVGQETSTK